MPDALQSAVVNAHCKHIIFGGPSDNGYARVLGPLSDDEKGRLTLLEGPPFAAELEALKSKFRGPVKFPKIFRSDKMTILHTTAGSTSASYASRASLDTQPRAPSPPGNASGVGKMQFNVHGQRVDNRLPAYPDALFNRVKSTRYCNLFHLRECYFKGCEFRHGKLVKGDERNVLMAVARWSSCTTGLYCVDFKCISGHACPRGDKCPSASGGPCRFPKEMHNVDQVVVRTE